MSSASPGRPWPFPRGVAGLERMDSSGLEGGRHAWLRGRTDTPLPLLSRGEVCGESVACFADRTWPLLSDHERQVRRKAPGGKTARRSRSQLLLPRVPSSSGGAARSPAEFHVGAPAGEVRTACAWYPRTKSRRYGLSMTKSCATESPHKLST